MRITLLQTAPEWGNPAQSREDARRMLMGTLKTDLVVLPEMFSTGFVTNPVGVAESEEGDSLRWMQDYARNKDCAVAGSVSVQTSEGYRNRFYFVFPDGHYIYYDKHHLFTYANEHERYKAGEERVVVEHAGFRILLQVCYDLRFPVFARNKMVTRGYGPILTDHINAAITIKTANPALKVYPMSNTGEKLPVIPSTYDDGKLSFTTSANTIYYIIE